MKSKKGFTLVEVLVVVLLLGLIAVSVVVISNKKKTEDERREYQEAIARSAAIYVDKYKEERFSDFNGGENRDFRYIMLNEIIAEGLLAGEKNNPFIDKNGKCSGVNCDVVEVYYEQNSSELKVRYPTDFEGSIDEETIYICGNISTEPQNYYLFDSNTAYTKYKSDSSIINNIQNGDFVYSDISSKKESYLDIYLCGYKGILKNAKMSFKKSDYDSDNRILKVGVKVDNIKDFTDLGYKLAGSFKSEDTKLVKVVDNSCPILLYNNDIYASSEVDYTGNYNDFSAFDNYDGYINYGGQSVATSGITSPDYGFNTPDFTLPSINNARGQAFIISRSPASNVSSESRTVTLRDSKGSTCNSQVTFACQNGLEFNSSGRCACDNSSKCTSGEICRYIASGEIKNGNGVCQCDKLHEYKDGKCVEKTCPDGKTLNSNGDCVCPKGSCINSNGQCGTCKEHETQEASSERCTCETGYVSNNGTCTEERNLYCKRGYSYEKDCSEVYSVKPTVGSTLQCISNSADSMCKEGRTENTDNEFSTCVWADYVLQSKPDEEGKYFGEGTLPVSFYSFKSMVYEAASTSSDEDYGGMASTAYWSYIRKPFKRSVVKQLLYKGTSDYATAEISKNCYGKFLDCSFDEDSYIADCYEGGGYPKRLTIEDAIDGYTQVTANMSCKDKKKLQNLLNRLITIIRNIDSTIEVEVPGDGSNIKYDSAKNSIEITGNGGMVYFYSKHIVNKVSVNATVMCLGVKNTCTSECKQGTTCEDGKCVSKGQNPNVCTQECKQGTTCEAGKCVYVDPAPKPNGTCTEERSCSSIANPNPNGCMIWNKSRCTCEWSGDMSKCT